jgi:UDP:flavonoid glycosyltransferase YjiC (YdhE family)
VVAVHAQAAARLGRRLVVQQGWAGLSPEALPAGVDRGAVFFAGRIPHARLFPRAAAVIHHGGIGTTACALRWGRPMLVEPYGNDQLFNARRVLALGVGAAMHPHRLTAEGLARILNEKVLAPPVQASAAHLAARLQAANGLAVACDQIDRHLARRKQQETAGCFPWDNSDGKVPGASRDATDGRCCDPAGCGTTTTTTLVFHS